MSAKPSVVTQIGVLVLIPLLVTVVGGVIVEAVKPKEEKRVAEAIFALNSVEPPQQVNYSKDATILPPGEWIHSSVKRGDNSIIITGSGKLIRYTSSFSGANLPIVYQLRRDEKGRAQTDPPTSFEVLKQDENSLDVVWDGVFLDSQRAGRVRLVRWTGILFCCGVFFSSSVACCKKWLGFGWYVILALGALGGFLYFFLQW